MNRLLTYLLFTNFKFTSSSGLMVQLMAAKANASANCCKSRCFQVPSAPCTWKEYYFCDLGTRNNLSTFS